MNRPVHFEIHVEDAERAMKFYKDVFGWNFVKWEESKTPYWMVMTAEKDSKEAGINGGMLPREGQASPTNCPSAFVCTMQVANYDDTAKKIEAGGGTVQMPKFALVGMAWQGYYKDTEGNIFGVHQADTEAK